MKWYTINWLRPSNRSAKVSLPPGPSNTYLFSPRSHGNSRRCRLISSRGAVNSFSFANNCLRAATHCAGDVTFGFSILLVAGVAMVVSPLLFFLGSKLTHVVSRPKPSPYQRLQSPRRRTPRDHRQNTHKTHCTHRCSPKTRR